MQFDDLMDRMRWAAREIDEIRGSTSYHSWYPDDAKFLAGHKRFGEALAWLQANRAAIEGLPTLVADSLRMCDLNERLNAENERLKNRLGETGQLCHIATYANPGDGKPYTLSRQVFPEKDALDQAMEIQKTHSGTRAFAVNAVDQGTSTRNVRLEAERDELLEALRSDSFRREIAAIVKAGRKTAADGRLGVDLSDVMDGIMYIVNAYAIAKAKGEPAP